MSVMRSGLANLLPNGLAGAAASLLLLLLPLAAGCNRAPAVPAADNPATPATARNTPADREWTVRRGEFPVTLLLEGTLDAIRHHELRCPADCRYGLEVVEIVPDHSHLRKGDWIVRFSRQKYEEKENELLLQLETEGKNLGLAEQEYQMQCMANLASLKAASDALKKAEEASDRYGREDAPLKRRQLLSAIEAASDGLAVGRRKLTDDKDLLSQAFMQDPDQLAKLTKAVENSTTALEKAQGDLDTARYNLRVFKQYDHAQRMREILQELTRAQIALQNELVRAVGKTIQARRTVESYQTRRRKLADDLADLRRQMALLEIRAPADGILSLGDTRRGQFRQTREITVGTSLKPNEILGTIPELTQFLVAINIPEFHRSKVATGLPAVLQVKAIPGLELHGRLTSIAEMATTLVSWDAGSPKIYRGEISTDRTDPRLMPGMTVRVEIFVETVRDALFLPVEAVFSREGKHYCQIRTALGGTEERQLFTGRASDHEVEITTGLNEGETVLLQRRPRDGEG
ncbi:MAG: hypothetical protein WC789_11920 [Lentisphaeria bacterium]|jgi:multidrug resistance efflux pump